MRSTPVLLWLSLLVPACGGEADEPSPEPTASARPQEGGRPEALPPEPLPGEPLLPESFAAKYETRDPGSDAWDTEAVSAALKKNLYRLDLALLEGELRVELTPGFACTPLRPEPLEVELEEEHLTLTRGAPIDGRTLAGPEGLAQAFAALLEPHREQAPEVHTTFKIKEIQVSGEDAETLVSFGAESHLEDGILGQHATWRCGWTRVQDRWALDWIDVLDFSEIRSRDPVPSMFRTMSRAVFAGNASWSQQLLVGLDEWASTLDAALGVSLIGHEGLALGDADGDGLDDLYVCQPGGLPNLLFLRRPDGTAEDVSRAAGVDWLDASRSALFLDLDGDGDQDLVVEADPLLLLMRNEGSLRFELAATVAAPSTTSLSAADFDLDGDLDLFACGYMLPDEGQRIPLPYHDANNGRPNTFLRNDVDGDVWAFHDVTAAVGLDRNNRRYSFSAVWEDYDDDGDPDLYVANDFGRNNLYRNDGGTFVDVAAEAGVEDMAAGMGVTWADYDLDGKLDLYVSNMYSSAGGRVTYQRSFQDRAGDDTRASYQRHARGNTLFRNRGDGTFEDVTLEAGVAMGRWAWGALFTDFQNDGRPDLVVPNGFVTGEDPDDL